MSAMLMVLFIIKVSRSSNHIQSYRGSPRVALSCSTPHTLLQPARRSLLPCASRPAAASASHPTAASASRPAALRVAPCCSQRVAPYCSQRVVPCCPASRPAAASASRPTAASSSRSAAPGVGPCCSQRVALCCPTPPPSRPASTTAAAAAARATTAAGGGAAGSAGSAAGAGGAGGANGSAGGAAGAGEARAGQRRSLPLPDDPTPQQLCEWVLQQARPGGGGFGFLRTAQRQQQSPQETFSPQVLSELFPQRCVTGSVEAAALGASESAAALGASESAAALGASESAAALGARASPATSPSSAEALHTFTLDSSASRCFFRDCTTLTPLAAPVPLSLADPTGGQVVARASTVLPCPAVPSGSLSGLHLPTFSTNLMSNVAIQDVWVDTNIPGGQRVAICTCSRTGRHLATFTRRPGSSLYTLTTVSAQVAEVGQVVTSSQVSASGQLVASCSCRVLSHQTLLWHHRLGHPSLPRLRGLHSCLLVSGLPRSLPTLPLSPAPPCLPCVEGRLWAAPHSSKFPPTTAPLQTLHMDVWGPAPVGGTDQERYFLLVVDEYTRYTTVFPLRRKANVSGVLIPWISATRRQLRERFSHYFQVLRLHSDRGAELSSDLLAELCRDEGIVQSSTSGPVSLSQRPRPHSGGRGRLAMRQCFGSEARSPLFAMPKRASSPLKLSAASSLASPPTPRRDNFTTHARGRAPSGVSQVDSPPLVEPLEISSDSSGPAEGGDPATDDTAATRRSPRLETPPGFPPRPSLPPLQPVAVDSGAEPAGAEPGGAETEGEGSGGAATGDASSWGAATGGADSGDPASPSGGGDCEETGMDELTK
ncbi:unnamed protein product [Closterium sp. NIES-54]